MRFLPLVLKNLLRKRTRSGLTVGSILLPFFVICLLGTFVAMLDADPSEGRGMYRLAVRHRVSIANVLPAAHLEKIRELPGVKAITPFNWFGGRYIDFREVEITVWGVGKAAMGNVMAAVQAAFDDQPLVGFPGGVQFMRCEPLYSQIDEEETIKQGEDYRAGVMRWLVWTDRQR